MNEGEGQPCQDPIFYVDKKGYVYCQKHGDRLISAGRMGVRKLRSAEIKKLNQGQTISY